MSIDSFLFNGSPPPSTTTYSTSTSTLPTWYSDYTQGLLSKADAIAATPYQAFPGPQVAPLSADQMNSYGQVRSADGSGLPTTQTGIGYNAQAAGMNPLAAAAGNLNTASQNGSSTMSNYMNPFEKNVTDYMAELQGRNLNENLIPAIGDQFTQAGQFGGSRMQEAEGRALRDTEQNLLGQQSQLNQNEFNQAATLAQNDLARQGQIGQVQGNLASAGQQNLNTIAGTAGQLGGALQTQGLQGAAALDAAGQEQQGNTQANYNAAQTNFTNQVNYPWQQIQNLNGALRGFTPPTSTSTANTGFAPNYTSSPLEQLVGGLSLFNGLSKAQ
jgi:hypothetical protein